MPDPNDSVLARPDQLSSRDSYDLLTSLVVPRPIGWISTRSEAGVNNLAPFSYFQALASSPPLVGVSIGRRKGQPKDTLRNIRLSKVFCVNLCSVDLLEAMNLTSGEYGEDVDEFSVAGLTAMDSPNISAPMVLEAPASLECEWVKEVELDPAPNVLVIGRVIGVCLSSGLRTVSGGWVVDPESLRPVGRLGRDRYMLPGKVLELPRPRVG
jgi:flavin reductase (DIM6/NTAB) family NADH-FMN oxidoreductase RutF